MTAISLNLYLSKISNCWNNGDGEELASLLSFRDNHVTNPKLQIPDPEAQVSSRLNIMSVESMRVFVSGGESPGPAPGRDGGRPPPWLLGPRPGGQPRGLPVPVHGGDQLRQAAR